MKLAAKCMRLIVCLSLAVVIPPGLFACECGNVSRAEEELNIATAVFIGKVTEIKDARTYFEVEKVLKGNSAGTLIIHRGGGKNCDFDFSEGIEYFVFATGPQERLAVSKCSNTSAWGHERFSTAELNTKTGISPWLLVIFCVLILIAVLLYTNIIPIAKQSRNTDPPAR